MTNTKNFLTALLLLFNTITIKSLASIPINPTTGTPIKSDKDIISYKQIHQLGRKRSLFLIRDRLAINPYSPKVVVHSSEMNVIYQPFNIRGGGIDFDSNYFKRKASFEGSQIASPSSSDYTWLFAKVVIERGFSSLIYLTTSFSELLTIARDYSSVLLESGLERQREKLLLQNNKMLAEAETKALARIEQKKENEAKLNRFGSFLQTSWKIFNEGRVKTEYIPLPVEKAETPKAEWSFPKISFWSAAKNEGSLNLGIFQSLLNFALILSKFKQK